MKIINQFLDIIQYKDIPDEGLSLVFDEAKSIEDVTLLSNLKGDAFFEKIKEDILLRAKFSTVISLRCDRCIEEFHFEINDNFIYTILNTTKKSYRDIDEEDVCYFDGISINFLDIIHEQIILQIPHKIICSENCKGICPVCGVNLNFNTCNCKKRVSFSPFEKLLNVKVG